MNKTLLLRLTLLTITGLTSSFLSCAQGGNRGSMQIDITVVMDGITDKNIDQIINTHNPKASLNSENLLHMAIHYNLNQNLTTNHVLSELVKHGVEVNGRNLEGNTPLHLALLQEHPNMRIVTFLLNNGAQPTMQNKDGDTALYLLELLLEQAQEKEAIEEIEEALTLARAKQ